MGKYVKHGRKCAAMRHKGPRAGERCGWWAKPDSVYCKRHGGNEGKTTSLEQQAANREGTQKYWGRIRQAIAAGLIDESPSAKNLRAGQRIAKANEARRLAEEKVLVAEAVAAVKRPRGRPKKDKRLKSALKIAQEEAAKAAKAAYRGKVKEEVANRAASPATIKKARSSLMHEREELPAVPDKPFEEMEPHEKLTVLTGMSLDFHYKVLSQPFDPVNLPKLASMQLASATAALAIRVKVDRNQLAARRDNNMMSLIERLKANRKALTNEPLTLDG